MCSGGGTRALPRVGFPIRKSPDRSSVSSSPGLIAAAHVLHRLQMPRHPPCALIHLIENTTKTAMEFSRCERRGAAPSRKARERPRAAAGGRGLSKLNSLGTRPRGGGRTPGVDMVPGRAPRSGRHRCHPTRPPRTAGAQRCGAPAVVGATAFPRKEVIQPQLPLRLPCYDFTPITSSAFGRCPPLRGWPTDFGRFRLSWCDGRCVQGPGTYSPRRC
jgi:hypothetical protein